MSASIPLPAATQASRAGGSAQLAAQLAALARAAVLAAELAATGDDPRLTNVRDFRADAHLAGWLESLPEADHALVAGYAARLSGCLLAGLDALSTARRNGSVNPAAPARLWEECADELAELFGLFAAN